MNFESTPENTATPDTLEAEGEIRTRNSEHLSGVARPIMASLSDNRINQGEALHQTTYEAARDIMENGEFVNYYEDVNDLDRKWMHNAGNQTYVISPITEGAKYSGQYRDCTGITVAGIDKETGKEISFLSHQDPLSFTKWYRFAKYKFDSDMSGMMQEMKSRAVPGSIDVVVFGGNDAGNGTDYKKSIAILGGLCKRNFGFEPVVLTGPDISTDSDAHANAFYDTANRRLHLVRPPQPGNATNESYQPSTLKEAAEKWKEK